MAYTAINDPTAYFQTKLWTGNGGTQSITLDGLNNMQPDWVWIKERSETRGHNIQDSVRGATKYLDSRSAGAEATVSNTLTSFDSNGFSLGSYDDVNKSSQTYVSWNWKAGTSFTNDASSTGIGTIDSAGSFNNDAGFSIVSWTGTLANGTVKHGLSTAPKTIFIKCRGTGARSWVVYHDSIGNTKHLTLSETDAEATSSASFNNTSPTSSVFSLGSSNNANDNTTMIAYCFAEKQGYSKFGSYTGNGNANGTFIYTGQKSSFIIVKNTSSSTNWEMFDNKRVGYNQSNWHLKPNSADAEDVGTVRLDILSNGFKIRTTGSNLNTSGNNYIYMCFAENPFVTSTGVPACAR